jgi:hypothetical protein
MDFGARMMRPLQIWPLLALFFASYSYAEKACPYEIGSIGYLRIGQRLDELKRRLGNRIELNFAGDGRSGVMVQGSKDLSTLRLSSSVHSRVDAADLLFREVGKDDVLIMISVGIDCPDAAKLKLDCANITASEAGEGNWTKSSRDHRYTWGADQTPICRFWLRAND